MPSHNAVSSNNWGAYSDFLKLDYKTLEKKFRQPFKLTVLAFLPLTSWDSIWRC